MKRFCSRLYSLKTIAARLSIWSDHDDATTLPNLPIFSSSKWYIAIQCVFSTSRSHKWQNTLCVEFIQYFEVEVWLILGPSSVSLHNIRNTVHVVRISLRWRHNVHRGVSYHRRLVCLFNRYFRLTSKKTSKPALLALCDENSPVTGGFPSQRASNAETDSIWWRHHVFKETPCYDICGWVWYEWFTSILKTLIPKRNG